MERFSLEVNGYNKEEVNRFLNEISIRSEALIDKYIKQQEEIERLQKEILELKKDDKYKIISDAKEMASRILNEALLKSQEEKENSELLKKNMTILRRRMDVLIEQEKAILKEFDDIEKEN